MAVRVMWLSALWRRMLVVAVSGELQGFRVVGGAVCGISRRSPLTSRLTFHRMHMAGHMVGLIGAELHSTFLAMLAERAHKRAGPFIIV